MKLGKGCVGGQLGDKMKYFSEVGWYLPKQERHLQGWMQRVNKQVHGRLTYQYRKYQACFPYIRPTRNIAIDVGAHVGLWSFYIAKDFKKVLCFEPIKLHRDCWHKNVLAGNALLYGVAVGEKNKKKVLVLNRTADSSGDTGIDLTRDSKGQGVSMIKLDNCPIPDGSIDFIKIDCEGYELFVLQGAEELLKKHKPCVIVEQKPETGGYKKYGIKQLAAVEYLQSLGAVKKRGIQGDYILCWEK